MDNRFEALPYTVCRTDVSEYCVYEDGRLVKTISTLQSYCGPFRLATKTRTRPAYLQVTAVNRLLCLHRTGSAQPVPLADMVTFYLGCSFGFEGKLKEAGIPVRNVDQGRNVSMYRVGLLVVIHTAWRSVCFLLQENRHRSTLYNKECKKLITEHGDK